MLTDLKGGFRAPFFEHEKTRIHTDRVAHHNSSDERHRYDSPSPILDAELGIQYIGCGQPNIAVMA